MGTSVKIVDLIDRYVEITGCQIPKIVYTGLRKGEKLHEELFDPSEIHMSTVHPKIMMVNVDQSGEIKQEDKIKLKSITKTRASPKELKEYLKLTIHLIENRDTTKNLQVDNNQLIELGV